MIYFLKNKNDAKAATERYLADISPYGNVKRLRCDNGTEYTSTEFCNLLIKNKIKQEFSSPYSPHQNGTAERMWRSLFEMARCLILEAGLPKYLWNYAVRASAYIRNRCFCERINCTPYEKFTSTKPDIANMHVFGSKCYAYIQNPKKLDARSQEGLFIGYDPNSPAYLIYFPENNIRRVRCVKFVDRRYDDNTTADIFNDENLIYPRYEVEIEPQEVKIQEAVKEDLQSQVKSEHVKRESVKPKTDSGTPVKVYPSRERKKPGYLKDYVQEIHSRGC